MIIDKIDNLTLYLPAAIREKVMSFISGLSAGTQEGKYPIDGDSVFASVQSYPLKNASQCRIEAHDKYIDIQSVIQGAEGIDVFERGELEVETPYDPANDAAFFKPGDFLRLDIKQNCFAALFPHEAHRPQLETLEHKFVKKFVIKVSVAVWK